ncbi:uncharacterized protein I303_104087 [Kwoniella dejecticola CBS 10117]|uniref:Peptidase A2 domain-containing protein n=1 Tax=Kwoniella dejecticola CBS 10117 TaxID=1296121 RepID=A0A1A6A8J8_9TREE|nr:uncharacterized protein I303_04105 [Kwoniella dejecticola CBS 10117]OBR86381.1 hypothetical protein I303_04105 [Kwoniella dejecticola CBS 10117]
MADTSPSTLSTLPVPQLFSLSGQTVIVVGGGRGIGASVVLGCLEAGANVSVLDLLPEPDKNDWPPAQAAAEKNGLTLTYGVADVTNEESLVAGYKTIFDSVNESSAPLRGLVVTAGVPVPISGLNVTYDQWKRGIDINLNGSFLSSQVFAKEWIKRNPKADSSDPDSPLASIVLTSSIHGQGFNRQVPGPSYGSAKAGIKHLASILGAEWGARGIRVNSISPGLIVTSTMRQNYIPTHPEYVDNMTKFTAVKRVADASELKAPVVFLLSKGSSFVTGTDLVIDGGHLAS